MTLIMAKIQEAWKSGQGQAAIKRGLASIEFNRIAGPSREEHEQFMVE